MNEAIIPCRTLVEGDADAVLMTRVGITCLNDQEELVSFVLLGDEGPYTVTTQVSRVPGYSVHVAHVFVDRFAHWARISVPFEIWRWHIDAYRPVVGAPPEWAKVMATKLKEDMIYRSSFEHVAGPEMTEPRYLASQFDAQMIPVAACSRELVPERRVYQKNHSLLSHPGLYDKSLGILVDFEDMARVQTASQTQKWVM